MACGVKGYLGPANHALFGVGDAFGTDISQTVPDDG